MQRAGVDNRERAATPVRCEGPDRLIAKLLVERVSPATTNSRRARWPQAALESSRRHALSHYAPAWELGLQFALCSVARSANEKRKDLSSVARSAKEDYLPRAV